MKIAVIGGGPAGMMAAIEASRFGQVSLFEMNQMGRKLLLTGGGRCNLTNLDFKSRYLRNQTQERFFRAAFSAFNQYHLMQFFECRGLKLKTEQDKVYPITEDAKDVLHCLLKELQHLEVQIFENKRVLGIEIKDSSFILDSSDAKRVFDNVIIATGGASFTNILKTTEMLQTLGIEQEKFEAGLVPLKTRNDMSDLSGVSCKVALKVDKEVVYDEVLFTHQGLSGPAALKLSSLINSTPMKIHCDFFPQYNEVEFYDVLFTPSKKSLLGLLKPEIAKAILFYLVQDFLDEDRFNLTKKKREELLQRLKNYEMIVEEKGALQRATISKGGVKLSEIRAKTMEHKRIPGLYFAGECLDLDAFTGGYNLQIAFSTGFLAGQLKRK